MNGLTDCMYDYRPQATPSHEIDTCEVCEEPIFEGEEYYDLHGVIVCECCLLDYVRGNFKK